MSESTASYDVVIVGASFAGLALAHHLPSDLRVLIVDAKPTAGATVESTGLITTRTREAFASFFEIDRWITNPITAICVVAPGFEDYFVSQTTQPWIYQTDTKGLVRHLADTLPSHVTLRTSTVFHGVDDAGQVKSVQVQSMGKEKEWISTKVLVGADGSRSKVAQTVNGLDRNEKFLFGFEEVFFGDVHLGPKPEETIYHFWFGEFSLGYGGWLSPTIVQGRKAFRIGLAKLMKDRSDAKALIDRFLQILVDKKMITIEGDIQKPDYVFGSMIPIGGTLKRIHKDNVLLIGDAAGFCGAFAADGIKGSIVSGQESAKLISRFLKGEKTVFAELPQKMNEHDGLMGYYHRQLRYRLVWDLMKSDRTFRAMYDIIEQEKDSFLEQFCDSKDKRKSLAWVVLKWKYIPKLFWFAWRILCDLGR